MVKIGYAVAHNPFTSTETWIRLEINTWKKRGYDIEIINTREGINLNKLRNVDFIIAHHCINGFRIMRTNIPFIVISHAHDIFIDDGELLRKVSRRRNCKGIGYISNYHKNLYEKWNIENNLIYTPVSIDIEKYTRKEPIGENILTGGRHIEKKGFDLAIKAVPNIHIFGTGPLTNYLKSISSEATFYGYVDDETLKSLYEKSWLYLFTGKQLPNGDMDGQPTTIKEALAMELQVVSTNIAGISDLKYIHLVERDLEKIRETINNLKKQRNVKGAKWVKKNYNPNVFVDNVEKFISNYI